MKNKHSMPHYSIWNDNHLDIYSDVEGELKPQKFHFEIEKHVEPGSIEALRERLKCEKGY